MKKLIYLLLLLTMVSILPSTAFAEKIILGGTLAGKSTLYGKWQERVYTEAFRRMGYDFECKRLPAARSSQMSDSGAVDGEIQRVPGYGKAHPNLIRVEEYGHTIYWVAMALKPGIFIEQWSSLKDTPYRVAYRRGILLSKKNLSNVVTPDKLSVSDTITSALKMLQTERIDLFVGVKYLAEEAIGSNPDFKNAGFYVAGTLAKVNLHAYLHKKHANLVPILSKTLKEMKEEGLFKQYKEEIMGRQ